MSQPVLLPVPRQVRWGGAAVPLPPELPLVLAARPQALLVAAERFQQAVQAALPVAVSVTASAAGLDGGPHVIVDPAAGPGAPAEGYRLTSAGGRVRIEAADAGGAAHGLATLKQLLLSGDGQIPDVAIDDAPDFPRRGVMLDISRGKVPTMPTLYALVDLLADLKLNELQLYTEHTFAYRQHRAVWQEYSPMTGGEILALDRYCRERGIDLVPNQQSFGHMTQWLIHAPYRHLAEAPDGWEAWGERHDEPYSLCPEEPAVLPFLAGLYDELLPHFSSDRFNVGLDETWDVGQGRSRAAVAARGEHRVYLDFLLKVHDLVQARGRKMQFWSDIIVQAPHLVPELPRDLIAMEWGYEAGHPFDRHNAAFAAAGIPFYVCPGCSNWNSIAGRTDNARANLREAAESGRQHGAAGYLITIWGDRGHQDYQPITYPGIAYGAALAWGVEANRQADVRPFLDRFVFLDRTGRTTQLLMDLGNVYQAVGRTPPNASVLGTVLHRGFDPNPYIDGLTPADFERAAAAVQHIAADLSAIDPHCADANLLRRELANTVRLLVHACELGKLRVGHPARPGRLGALATEMAAIIAEHRHLWLARNRSGGLEQMSLVPLWRILDGYRRLLS